LVIDCGLGKLRRNEKASLANIGFKGQNRKHHGTTSFITGVRSSEKYLRRPSRNHDLSIILKECAIFFSAIFVSVRTYHDPYYQK
jgi:hypothetical protein